MVDNLTPNQAKKALESVVKMEDAGWRRAVPGRWFAAGVAVLIAGMFAIYALEDPYPYIVFPIIGLPLFITTAREKSGAYGRDAPNTANVWAIVLFLIVLVIVFSARSTFGGHMMLHGYRLLPACWLDWWCS